MNLPALKNPELYQGLYVFDFGDHAAAGYTAEEIDVLLASPEHKGGRAYKIHHAAADGQLSLRGLSRIDVGLQEATIFYRRCAEAARADFDALKQSATLHAPPVPLHWHLACDSSLDPADFTILIYAAEASDRVGRWLEAIAFAGGDRIEAGQDVADHYRSSDATEHDRIAIAPDARYHSRPAAEVLATVGKPIQRELASP